MSSKTLLPASDSAGSRVRGASHIDFKTATTGVAAKAMRNELGRLVSSVKDQATKKVGNPTDRVPPQIHATDICGRHSTQKCSHSSISLLGTSLNAQRTKRCNCIHIDVSE